MDAGAEALRACGCSQAKVKALHGIAEAYVSGGLDFDWLGQVGQ